jgi:hypothetical protein
VPVNRHYCVHVPIDISRYLRGCTPQVCIGDNHAFQKTFDRLGHVIFSNPFSPHGPIPVFLQVFLLFEDLTFLVFKRGASNENFEESYSERPNVGFSGVVRESPSTLGGEILGCTIRQVTVKGFGRTKIILFSKSEIDENRDISRREENISRLDIVVYDTPGV